MTEARERPITMSAPMVRALLAGTKTQTRRVLKPQPDTAVGRRAYVATKPGYARLVRTPDVGDVLWIRETWKPHSTFAALPPRETPPSKIFYAADDAYAPSNTPWRPSIHMPRWASRLTLTVTVTDVRVQRLQDISEEDAVAEGVHLMRDGGGTFVGREGPGCMVAPWPTAAEAYADLWNSLHGPGAWDANPWVAAISFTVERRGASYGA